MIIMCMIMSSPFVSHGLLLFEFEPVEKLL
jgi:hypothetical protein